MSPHLLNKQCLSRLIPLIGEPQRCWIPRRDEGTGFSTVASHEVVEFFISPSDPEDELLPIVSDQKSCSSVGPEQGIDLRTRIAG